MDELISIFVEDALDQLGHAEAQLLSLEEASRDAEALNAIFRAIHTIKGDAGIIDLPHIERFAHTVESFLDPIRKQTVAITAARISDLLACCDHLRTLIRRIGQGLFIADPDLEQHGQRLLELLQHDFHAPPATDPTPIPEAEAPVGLADEEISPPPPEAPPVPEAGQDSTPASAPASDSTANAPSRSPEQRQLRVAVRQLDRLVNQVGELVTISLAAAHQASLCSTADAAAVNEAYARLGLLVGQIRDASLELRMVPLSEQLGRYRRQVRDLALYHDKPAELQLLGGDTEIDHPLLESLGEIIGGLIRHGFAHSLEAPAVRQELGKPASASLRISASQRGNSLYLTLTDDGDGVRGSSLEAQQETAWQGARAQVDRLGGRLQAQPDPDQGGTLVTLQLPLSLAVAEGFLCRVGSHYYALPLDCVLECLDSPPGQQSQVQVQGRLLPVLDLRQQFGLPPKRHAPEGALIVVHRGEQEAGLRVDSLHGECQMVLKPLPPLLAQTGRPFVGATLLGSGDIALILDLDALLRQADNPTAEPATPPAPASPAGPTLTGEVLRPH